MTVPSQGVCGQAQGTQRRSFGKLVIWGVQDWEEGVWGVISGLLSQLHLAERRSFLPFCGLGYVMAPVHGGHCSVQALIPVVTRAY